MAPTATLKAGTGEFAQGVVLGMVLLAFAVGVNFARHSFEAGGLKWAGSS